MLGAPASTVRRPPGVRSEPLANSRFVRTRFIKSTRPQSNFLFAAPVARNYNTMESVLRRSSTNDQSKQCCQFRQIN